MGLQTVAITFPHNVIKIEFLRALHVPKASGLAQP